MQAALSRANSALAASEEALAKEREQHKKDLAAADDAWARRLCLWQKKQLRGRCLIT